MTSAHPDSVARPAAGADIVEVEIRPAGRSVLLIAGLWLWLTLLLWAACWLAVIQDWWPDARALLLLGPIGLLLMVLSIAAIIRNAMRFQLSRHRVRAAWGVFSRVTVEARLEDIRNIAVVRSFAQRLLGLGTIELTTAGIGPSVVWLHIARPDDLAARVRYCIDSSRASPPSASSPSATPAPVRPIHAPVFPSPSTPAAKRLPVIGLAGGIGAGKSTVAQAFARQGCFVIDSDARAKAALDRPDVRRQLVEWWGDSILSSDGRVDRSKIAAIIFADPEQRRRLEQLVHPIVREDRATMIREALAAGARAVVVDAPLLFEAGVDSECDTIVFVDAPREQRLERVQRTRQWDEQELARREASQLSVEEKRRRSGHVVENSGKLGGIDEQVGRILTLIEAGT
jgi:dephospho-CoA kinase